SGLAFNRFAVTFFVLGRGDRGLRGGSMTLTLPLLFLLFGIDCCTRGETRTGIFLESSGETCVFGMVDTAAFSRAGAFAAAPLIENEIFFALGVSASLTSSGLITTLAGTGVSGGFSGIDVFRFLRALS